MTKHLKLDPYPFFLTLVTDSNPARVYKYIRKTTGQDVRELLDGDFSGITSYLENNTWLIFIPDTNIGSYLLNVVAHECSHLVYQLFSTIGIDDDESQAYLIGHLTETIMNHCRKSVINFKKRENNGNKKQQETD